MYPHAVWTKGDEAFLTLGIFLCEQQRKMLML